MQSWMSGQAMADFGSASFGRKLVATRSVADGVSGYAADGRQSSKARWYVAFASAKRSDVCRARPSLNNTTAIACCRPRRSSRGSSAR